MRKLIIDPKLPPINDKVTSGERLSFADGVALYNSPDILTLGQMASIVRERKNGNKAYYNLNQHIDYSNICVLHTRCRFCAYARGDISEEGAFQLSVEDFLAKAKYAPEHGCTEIHSVGGLHPTLPLEYYLELLRRLKEMMPQIALKFLTAVEIHHIARLEKLPVGAVLQELKDAGLDFIPGGGAEIFAEETRQKICPGKLSGEGWLDVMRQAHELGIKSNATMLYGHIDRVEDRIDHLLRLRQLQDETGGFMAFVPLAFHPQNTRMSHLPETTGATELKTIAISRLMLDNFDHIKAYWVMMGTKLAQVALSFGADDMHGTVMEEKISHAAGASTPHALSVAHIENLIREAGRTPIERDTFYQEIARAGKEWHVKGVTGRSAVKVGAVSYLNTKPLIYTLPQIAPEIQLSVDIPSRLADQLKAKELDVALIPAIEYLRNPGYRIIPNISIASHGEVKSIKLFSRIPLEKIRRVALDTSSRTSIALLKILLKERYKLTPEYAPYTPQPGKQENEESCFSLPPCDAVLLIGDAAMQKSTEGLYTLDLGDCWRNFTRTPFVYALWVARSGVELGDIPQRLLQAKQAGLQHLSEIARREAPKLGLPAEVCHDYLRHNIQYELGDAELEGLRLFYNYAIRLNLAEPGQEIIWG